ncbi:MAG TPA: hypothetical protein VIV82_11515 [Verrucomicrobiae bacterium]
MKIVPTTGENWIRLITWPFKGLVLAYGVFYPFWLYSQPGVPGTIEGPDYSVIEKAALAYLFVAIALLLLSGVQSSLSDRRGAFWSAAFAVLALIIAYGGTFHPHFK